MDTTNFTITADTAQALLNYLATRPYSEVFQLISDLHKGTLGEAADASEES
jgi:hypothetical protein